MQRLRVIERGVTSGAPTPALAAGALLRGLRQLLGRGSVENGDMMDDPSHEENGDVVDGGTPHELPEVIGVVRGCYHRASDEERASTGWDASTGRFARERVQSITVTTDPNDPDLHPYAAGDDGSGAPPERGILCQTAEAYDKLRGALPENAGSLSEQRPGSAENLYLEGLSAWELCIGDIFTLKRAAEKSGGSGQLTLQVTSPRRPCEQWNQVHATSAFLEGTALVGTPPQRLRLQTSLPLGEEDTPGNVRHYCLQNTLGGFFFRVLCGGEICVGDSLVLSPS